MSDEDHMAHALALGSRGLGRTWPNPAVGCVILRQGRVLGRGWTQPGGRPHAETMALAQAENAAGSTVYVTLEPCAHHGKTPPCVDALITARVARVVTALIDPDHRVSGKGHATLRAAGIVVTENILSDQATIANKGFLKRITTGLPAVTLKLAATLDGRIATASGESRWITGPDARRHVHTLRLTHDAVLIGAGTARADDPDLTARNIGATHQPIRVLLDGKLSHSPDSRLGQSAATQPVWIIHGAEAPASARAAWSARGATLFPCPTKAAHLDLTKAFEILADQGLTRILCEGGGTIAAALIRANLVDDLIQISAGSVIGADGIAAIAPLGLKSLAAAPRFRLQDSRTLGPDTISHWTAI